MNENGEERKIAEHIFSGSTTMIGVCLTVLTLFNSLRRIAGATVVNYADEILAFDAFIFTISALLSYSSLRKGNEKTREWIADIIFFIGMSIMAVVGLLIVFFP